jgi:hypothetical protein
MRKEFFMRTGMIQCTIEVLQTAFHDLQVSPPLRTLEHLAVMIHRTMGGSARHFHTLEHIFDLIEPSDPLRCLAALFHDIVYYQVDKGFPPEISTILAPYLQEMRGDISIAETIPSNDRLIWLTLDVFEYDVKQPLSLFGGLNEFLSAVVMNKTLAGIVPEQALLQITACIEATIPFRGKNTCGENWPESLEHRLKKCNERYNLSLTSGDIEEAIKRAVLFANSDVANFAEHDVTRFLDNTWKLLPETNSVLRSNEIYFIRDYRRALQKMEGFLRALNPDNIFTCYRGVPPEKEFQHMVTLAHQNIEVAREYLGIKLLTAAILEALAEMTGGDAPLALFMGEVRREGDEGKRLEDFLPGGEASDITESSSVVFILLNSGRASEIPFDMRSSPLSFFIYKHIGPTNTKQALIYAKEMFAGKLSAQDFLNSIDRPVLSAIAQASAAMVGTRRTELLRYTIPDHSIESALSL